MTTTSILLAVGAILVCGALGVFNGLIRTRNRALQARARVAVECKRRADLLPNLVAAVRGYMAHESATLEAVARARTEGETDAASRGLLARIEAYPQIRADMPARELMEDLRSTENRIAYARDQAIEFERRYRDLRGVFPLNLVARLFGFADLAPGREHRGEMAPEDRSQAS